MTEYINKAKALHEMWQSLYAIEDKLEKEHGLDICERLDVQMGFEAGLETIVNMPTIDIVHCYECKYWQVGKMDLGLDCHTYPDHFCAEGERKTDE